MNEQTIFAEAIGIESSEERMRFLDSACGENGELRQAVQRLLELADNAGSFLEHPALQDQAALLDGMNPTMAFGAGSTRDDNSSAIFGASQHQPDLNDALPLGHLQPATREGSLGRLGHYEILEVVGKGAFGTVLRAIDTKLERIVAIKILAPEMASLSPARKRFLREARTSAQIRHENVVRIYSVEEEPIPYLVMEYIPGKTLQTQLDERGPLDLASVLRLGKQIADGLAAAHAQDLIHRDIKPGNILLEGGLEERIKITDFGLARTIDDASMTQSGTIAGTPMYMAPEQVHGHKLDQRADLFSLGSVLYQMLSGRPPFRASTTIAVLKRVVDDNPRPIQEIIPEVPDWLCELVGHLHAKDPDQRYSSAREVSQLLARCAAELQAGRVPEIPRPSPTAEHVEKTATADVSKPKLGLRGESRPGRSLVKIAAVMLIATCALGLSEATGVTHLAATIIRLTVGSGTLVIETDDPGVKIAVDGEEVTITGGGVQELTLRPGEYKVAALKDGAAVKQELVSITRNGRTVLRMSLEGTPGALAETRPDPRPSTAIPRTTGGVQWPDDAPPPAIAPFDDEQAQAHQVAWAKYLGRPVEFTNSLGMKFRLIPPGEFLMGSTPAEIEEALQVAAGDEIWQQFIRSGAPQHKVVLSQPLYVGVTEVTQAQYERVMGANPAHFSANGAGSGAVAGLETGGQPVEMVSLNDAAEFCAKASQREQLTPCYSRSGEHITQLNGNGYRLPTEAEWEFACRAGTTTCFWSGDDNRGLNKVGWLGDNSAGRPHAVGVLRANAFGLSDVHGNVWEWVSDYWDAEFYEQFTEQAAIDPSNSLRGSERVIRGGDWGSTPSYCRSSFRSTAPPTAARDHIGFRVVLPVEAAR